MRILAVVAALALLATGCDGYTTSGAIEAVRVIDALDDIEIDVELSGDFNVGGTWTGRAVSAIDDAQADFMADLIQREDRLSGGFSATLGCFSGGGAGAHRTAVRFVNARFVAGSVIGILGGPDGSAQARISFDLHSPPNQFSFDGVTVDNRSMTAEYALTNRDAGCSDSGMVTLQKS